MRNAGNPYGSPQADAHSDAHRTSGLAIASLVLSCLSVLIGPFGFLPVIICGHLARSECRRNQALTGAGLALAGLIVGYISVGLSAAMLLVVALVIHSGSSSEPFVYTMF